MSDEYEHYVSQEYELYVRDQHVDSLKAEVARLTAELAASRQRITELEAEVAALKQPPTYHDVDAYYRPETCEWCKWFAKAGGIAWCGHESGPGEWTGTKEEPCCNKWEGKEDS